MKVEEQKQKKTVLTFQIYSYYISAEDVCGERL